MSLVCRDADQPAEPCKYVGTCHDIRQAIAHKAAIRGQACEFYREFELRRIIPVPVDAEVPHGV